VALLRVGKRGTVRYEETKWRVFDGGKDTTQTLEGGQYKSAGERDWEVEQSKISQEECLEGPKFMVGHSPSRGKGKVVKRCGRLDESKRASKRKLGELREVEERRRSYV